MSYKQNHQVSYHGNVHSVSTNYTDTNSPYNGICLINNNATEEKKYRTA